MQSYDLWKMVALFASYAWNASPIDGLDVIRSLQSCEGKNVLIPITHSNGWRRRQDTNRRRRGPRTLGDDVPTMVLTEELLKTLKEER
jgi:hypothetical protein